MFSCSQNTRRPFIQNTINNYTGTGTGTGSGSDTDGNYNFSLLNAKITQLELSLNAIVTDISTIEYRVDASLNATVTDISTIEYRVDASLNAIVTDISTIEYRVDDSLNAIVTDISTIENRVDASLNAIVTDISTIETRVDNISFSSEDTNLYFLTYTNEYYTYYVNYKAGIELYNKILCVNTFFNNNTIDHNNIFNPSESDSLKYIVDDIVTHTYGITQNNNSSMISFNLPELYKYLLDNIYINDSNIGEPSLNMITKALTINSNNKIPLYISWGNLTPKLMHYMHINPDEYLINFGPSYYDELFRLNLLVKELNGDTDFANTTIFYLIIDGDFYNYALRFFYTYAKNITIFNLLSTTYDKIITLTDDSQVSVSENSENSENSIPTISTSQDGSVYNKYINAVYENKTYYSFNRDIIDNDRHRIDSFPNVVLINIPDAENVSDKNDFLLGKAVNKSLDIMKKYYNTLNSTMQNNSYIYINTDSAQGEQSLINSLLNKTLTHGLKSNNDFVNSSKVIISSYNNIEYNLKDVAKTKTNYINNLNNLYVLSAYNLGVSNEAIMSLSTFNEPKHIYKNIDNKNFDNYNKIQYSINVDDYHDNDYINILSYQKLNLGILEANLFNYIILLIIEQKHSRNFKNENNQYHKITGEEFYTFYTTKMEILFNYNLTNSIFEILLTDFINNNNPAAIDFHLEYQEYYEYYLIDDLQTQDQEDLNNNIDNNGFIDNGSRIRTFNLYQKNNNNFTKIPILQNPIYTEYDKFEDAISSVFYEYIMLIDTSINIYTPDNTYTIYDLSNIIDFDNSILIKSSSLAQIIENCPNIYLKFSDISDNIRLQYTNLENVDVGININNGLEILGSNIRNFWINITSGNGDFKIQLYINNIKNIYNTTDDNKFKLFSNTITVKINTP